MGHQPELEANYGGVFDIQVGFGERPVVLSVDFINAYTTQGADFFAPGVVRAVDECVELYEVARHVRVPIIYTRVCYQSNGRDGGLFVRKVPALRSLTDGDPLAEIVDVLSPAPEDVILIKKYASAFFGTPLAAMLSAAGMDTVILTGCSTSGCIRATAIDGIQNGFRVVVPRECVGDRHDLPHEANLFDINAKYGDVVSRAETLRYLRQLGAKETS